MQRNWKEEKMKETIEEKIRRENPIKYETLDEDYYTPKGIFQNVGLLATNIDDVISGYTSLKSKWLEKYPDAEIIIENKLIGQCGSYSCGGSVLATKLEPKDVYEKRIAKLIKMEEARIAKNKARYEKAKATKMKNKEEKERALLAELKSKYEG